MTVISVSDDVVDYDVLKSLDKVKLSYCKKLRSVDFFSLSNDDQMFRLKLFKLEMLNIKLNKVRRSKLTGSSKTDRDNLNDLRKDLYLEILNHLDNII